MLDEMERYIISHLVNMKQFGMNRSLHDALCIVKRVLETKYVVPGGGAVESALAIFLETFATTLVRITTCCES